MLILSILLDDYSFTNEAYIYNPRFRWKHLGENSLMARTVDEGEDPFHMPPELFMNVPSTISIDDLFLDGGAARTMPMW